MIRFATVGTSWITESFIKGTNLLGGKLKLDAVYSRTVDKGRSFAEKFGCGKVYTDINELARDKDIDAVYIASPNAFHYIQSRIMLKAGKHVICEKPITVTPEEFTELNALAESKGLVYMEALMAQYLPARTSVAQAIGRIGRISHVRFDFSQRSSKYDSLMSGCHENIFDPKMAAGALMDLGIYCVYPCIDWFSEPLDIYSYCTKLFTGIDGEGGALFKYDGFTAELTYSKTGNSRLVSEIIGDGGTIVIPSISKLTNIKIISNGGTETQLTHDTDKPALMSFEADAFYRFITEPQKYSADLKKASELSLKVNRALQTMREKAGIEFCTEV